MQITLYRRTYAAPGSPVVLTFLPDRPGQRHTFAAGGRVYEATQEPLTVVVPDGAKLDFGGHVLYWQGAAGQVRSTAQEVYDLAAQNLRGFRLVR